MGASGGSRSVTAVLGAAVQSRGTDDLILRQLIRNRYKYLGMLGSAEKVRVMFDAMRKNGFTEEEIGQVQAPIGLPIHSRTPEEIAVSIAAKIIGVRNG